MKRFFLGVLLGVLIGWVSVPVVHSDEDDNLKYKQYLFKMLQYMKTMNVHLQNIENNTRAVKEKLHA